VLEDASLLRSKELTLVEPHPKQAPFVEFCGDIVMGGDTSSIRRTNPISYELFDLIPISHPLLTTTPHVHAFHESLGYIRGYNSSFYPFCAYLQEVPRKIMWSTFFYHTFDFSMAFDEFKRPLTLPVPSSLLFSYSHHSEMHATTYDKLLRALAASQ